MVAAESEARSAGLPRLILRVRTSLSGNKAYFEGQGFAVTGQGQDPGRALYAVMERTIR